MTSTTSFRNGPSIDVARVRADFPILSRKLAGGKPLVYLDTAATAQKPRCVIDKIVECCEQYNSNVHRGIHQLGDRMTNELEESRNKVASLIGAESSDEVVFTSGTTMSLNLAARGWGDRNLKPGDEILLNQVEHHAQLVPWQLAAQASGATIRMIPLTSGGELDLSRLDEVLTRRTKVLAVTGMSNVLGTVNPVEELAQRAHDVGAIICVDGAQSIPHLPINVAQAKIDLLAFSGHKLYGPTGIGVLYGRRDVLEQMDPLLGGGHMIREVFADHATWADLPARFEAGTCPFIEAVALGTAIDYLEAVGFDAIHQYETELLIEATRQLGSIEGLRILGPQYDQADSSFTKRKGAIISFTLDTVHPHDLADLVDRSGVAIRAGHHCTMPLHDWLGISASGRASFAFYNTLDEIGVLVEAIQNAIRVFQRGRKSPS